MSEIMYPHRRITERTRDIWRTIAIKVAFNEALTEQEEKILQAARNIINTNNPTPEHINQLRIAINNHDQHTG